MIFHLLNYRYVLIATFILSLFLSMFYLNASHKLCVIVISLWIFFLYSLPLLDKSKLLYPTACMYFWKKKVKCERCKGILLTHFYLHSFVSPGYLDITKVMFDPRPLLSFSLKLIYSTSYVMEILCYFSGSECLQVTT